MPSYMELIFIDSDELARKTDMRSSRDTDADTWAAFRALRAYAVDIKKATFLIDYHKANNDIADTIAIDDTGFVIITGQKPKSEAAYRKIDADYWAAARSAAA